MNPIVFQHDVLIIGSGTAGLSLALHLAPQCRVALVCKQALAEGASLYAQGGIAAVLDGKADSLEAHIADTLNAGAGLCDPAVVRFTVEHASSAIHWLIAQGVGFTATHHTEGERVYHLAREGGHSRRRIVHVADETGRAVQTTLAEQVRRHPNIDRFEYSTAIELIVEEQRCNGAYVLMRDKRLACFKARCVALATGGASGVYLHTTLPEHGSGDGIAMAWRAGCGVANLEFNQFHPTCLYHPEADPFLITEAVRGEGGRLILPDGTRFMPQFDEHAELAPRDIVARAIDHEMKRAGLACVYLDISHHTPTFIREHFPAMYARCLAQGIDITQSPIPVIPAAHYTCGGVTTDARARTDIAGLYAIGETAHTGLHGANRLASNSLLECLVFSQAASEDILRELPCWPSSSTMPAWQHESTINPRKQKILVAAHREKLRQCMWDCVGLVRSQKKLEEAKHCIFQLKAQCSEQDAIFYLTHEGITLRNLLLVSELMVVSALARRESRGLHYNTDYPRLTAPQNTHLLPNNSHLHRESLASGQSIRDTT